MGALAAAKAAIVPAIFSTSADFTVATAHPAAAEHPHIFMVQSKFFLSICCSIASNFFYIYLCLQNLRHYIN
jgi:hypothetical protein